MKFNKVIKEASAEIYGDGTQERVTIKIGNRNIEFGELRRIAPNSYSAIIKATSYAKKQGFNMTLNKAPADIIIMGDSSVKITDDATGKVLQPTLVDLGFTSQQIVAIKKEIKQ